MNETTPGGGTAGGPSTGSQPPSDPPPSHPYDRSPPPPPTTPARPALRRPREGRLIAGVAAGVAEHVGMDVAIVRILFVVATIFTSGFGVAAYALAWILIPEPSADDPSMSATARRELGGRDPLFWVGIGLLLVGAVWLLNAPWFGPFGPWLRPDGGVLVPLVLIAFGVALWRASDERRHTGTTTPVSGATPQPVWRAPDPSTATYRSFQETAVNDDPTRTFDPEADRDTTMLPRPDDGPGAPPPGVPPTSGSTPPSGFSPPPGMPTAHGSSWSPPPVPPRESSVLVRSTLGLALVTAGVLWLLRVADVLTLGAGRILAAALLVVGLGLLVGTVVGRGRGLIGVGLVLLPIVVLAELLSPMNLELGEFRQGVGQHRVAPATIDDLEPSYQLGAGTLTVDLSQLELDDTYDVALQVGFGELVVVVPHDVSVEVTGRVAGGEFTAFGRRSDGLAVSRTVTDEVEDAQGELVLDVQVAFGQATVRRGPSTDTATD